MIVQRRFNSTTKSITFTPRVVSNSSSSSVFNGVGLVCVSSLSILALVWSLRKKNEVKNSFSARVVTLPGYGILGDKVNELLELFLDALAVYVHNDSNWDCQERMLCEANQQAHKYGMFHGLIMYFLSLSVSAVLKEHRMSKSLIAMRVGRNGLDCSEMYPRCPYRL